MITRGLDGTFYEIPDDTADQYKVPQEEVQAKLGSCGCSQNAQMGMGQEMMGPQSSGSPQGVVINVINPTAVQNPMMGGQQPPQQQGAKSFLHGAGEGAQAEGAAGQLTGTCYSCYCYCYSCYCYSCYCYRTCYSCYVQPV
ncbi:hypothetical protein KP004_06890 [Geomonas oryzisoli]|uniref:Uncharacterized protein n=1 Tax=Geomonas oryzisoli TaxID=2847992 RepID=A0ABX8J8Y8_9BACT|nr:hypothetical protein [Geomonas oryzisoli]QWV94898.1 hypothetical protein KP004_06890 [Geomonas oryzisoli]